ncbi:MAG: hypothetical protein ABIJ09_06660 [Pseudomonadota bacterium]
MPRPDSTEITRRERFEPLSEDERIHLLKILGEVGNAAMAGDPRALAKLAELLVDDSLVWEFPPRDQVRILRRVFQILDQAFARLSSLEFWALSQALGRREARKGAMRLLRRATLAGRRDAIAMLRKAVRVPGHAAELAADILAGAPDQLTPADLLAVGVRALQADRDGDARRLLHWMLAQGSDAALQAVRTLLWRSKPFIDEDHRVARLHAALALTRQPALLASEDLPHVRDVAASTAGEPLVSLYNAADGIVERSPPVAGALVAFAGIVADAELGEDPARGQLLEPLARPKVLQRFVDYEGDTGAQRALAPLALIWSEEQRTSQRAARLLQRPVLDGDKLAIAAAVSICEHGQQCLTRSGLQQIVALLEASARGGHAATIVELLLEVLQRGGENSSEQILDGLERCVPRLPATSMLRTLAVHTIRSLAQQSSSETLRHTLNVLVVSRELAEEKTVVRERGEATSRARVRRGLGGSILVETDDDK